MGAQYITRDPKIGCADSAFSLLLAQILGAQMRTLRTQLHCLCIADTSTKYNAIAANDGQGISGACVKDCTDQCSNYFCDGKCFKSYGWYPNFEPNGHYMFSTCEIQPQGKIEILHVRTENLKI